MNWAPYQAATGCTQYGPDGARALLVFTEDVFDELHRSMGICNCRSTRGGSSWSHHAECRGYDAGFDRIEPLTFAYDLTLILGEHGLEAGIDHVITNKKPWATDRGEPVIFSARSPNGRVYTGAHPHKDHNHNGLTRNAGVSLTYSKLVSLYGTPQEVADRLTLGTQGDELLPLKYRDGFSDGRPGKKADVQLLQALLGVDADGLYGNDTAAAVAPYSGGDGKLVDGVTYAKVQQAAFGNDHDHDSRYLKGVKGIR